MQQQLDEKNREEAKRRQKEKEKERKDKDKKKGKKKDDDDDDDQDQDFEKATSQEELLKLLVKEVKDLKVQVKVNRFCFLLFSLVWF